MRGLSVRGLSLEAGYSANHWFRGIETYRVFSRDVTAAMLVSLNKATAAMLVSPTNPLEIELYSYANAFFCFG